MQDILVGNWNELRGQIKLWWGKLTNDDLQKINGKYTLLVGLLQERYGYTRPQAEHEINRRLLEYERNHRALA